MKYDTVCWDSHRVYGDGRESCQKHGGSGAP